MSYDVAFRHQQALDPSALVSVATCLHALTAAIEDCRNAGKDAESDPAVLLLAQHLGSVASVDRPPAIQLRRGCMDQIAEIRRNPALLVLAHKGVSCGEEIAVQAEDVEDEAGPGAPEAGGV